MKDKPVTAAQWKRWGKRALTIRLKADELQSQLMGALGADDYATDMGDNLVCAVEDLIAHIDRRLP